MHRTRTRGLIIIGLALLVVVFSSTLFATSQRGFEIYPSPYLSQTRLLSDYNPNLAGTAGDTEVLFFEGKEPGGTLLVIGGTHADEPAGVVSALLFAENVKVTHGRLIVIPFANRSAFTHNLPQSPPALLHLETLEGNASSNTVPVFPTPIHQWPDPTVYVQQVDGQKLAGVESAI